MKLITQNWRKDCGFLENIANCTGILQILSRCLCHLSENPPSNPLRQALRYQRKHLEIARREKNVAEEERAHTTIGRTYFIQAETLQGVAQMRLVLDNPFAHNHHLAAMNVENLYLQILIGMFLLTRLRSLSKGVWTFALCCGDH